VGLLLSNRGAICSKSEMPYVGKWRRESEQRRRQLLSPQYRKAWDAGFSPELWPAEETEFDGRLSLRLKDGTILPAS
jgi:hypothetical protein